VAAPELPLAVADSFFPIATAPSAGLHFLVRYSMAALMSPAIEISALTVRRELATFESSSWRLICPDCSTIAKREVAGR
jgi:hypothetical protein